MLRTKTPLAFLVHFWISYLANFLAQALFLLQCFSENILRWSLLRIVENHFQREIEKAWVTEWPGS